MNHIKERSYLLDELGDPDAPIGSRLWCLSLANEIRKALHDKQWHGGRLQDLANVFFEKEAWKELGYKSWEECCLRRFQTSPAEFEKQVKLRENGGDRRSEEFQSNNCNTEKIEQQGNSKAYTEARLERDNPDLYESVKRGELSAHAAAIEAGWRKAYPRYSISADPEKAGRFLFKNVDREWMRAMVAAYEDACDAKMAKDIRDAYEIRDAHDA